MTKTGLHAVSIAMVLVGTALGLIAAAEDAVPDKPLVSIGA